MADAGTVATGDDTNTGAAGGRGAAADGPLLSYADATAHYAPVLGLETHIELGTESKMFCSCATGFGAEPNTQVCPVCLALPGALPVVNESAVEGTLRIGLALNCTIASWCRFARKNYFYPDMPKNYQISQYDEPLCTDGYLDVTVEAPDGSPREFRVGIERVHMEEDTGKTAHVGGATGRIHGADYSVVDYNRAGIPLIEIVTKPIEGAGELAPEVARAYVRELRDLVRSLGVSDVRMEEGSLRCDVNVSLMPHGAQQWGVRSETKNVNSLRSVDRAVRHEMRRHATLLVAGEQVRQETRHFQEQSGSTVAGRSKEEAEDYRYFPDPDLVPVAPSSDWVERLRSELPELPAARRARIQTEWQLTDEELRDLVNADAIDLVAATVSAGAPSTEARKWWLNELSRRATEADVPLTEVGISPAQVARVVQLVTDGTLTNKLARQVVDGVLAGEGEPDAVVESRGLRVVSDDSALGAAVDTAIAENPDAAEKVRNGKAAAAGAIVGAVMKATQGQADAARARELILERLGG
ncbi:Asp-tRNA(Asn)/Glu-tRNA(Gln) amidotransferase subunit GatB [Lipingzhangella sp. LS1_29]|uniref:Aspartyl/glutamyl-tRNA(Asn/Gln) amidotransferase subunit B n=1 Tax=Lipingzhangella rawalii TaxID=2055835 RepID=A0ABU2HAZ2_9ACTN|nr:Asp-tRNA(Asn)/Glu-tRNA(Gln) amidotransferase subunit GatB [Lipingzhangella rawalii]MDS1272010.1 Asp-tRNA(Asn)/Glu-tRNA(Gln) amidotransferase subunit GatB [Lipingzhangella rawalii]